MSQHGREHEELLAALLAGDLPPSDPRAVELLASCEHCRGAVQALRPVTAMLEQAFSEQEEDLVAIERAPPMPGDEHVRAQLEALAPRARRSFLVWGLAAAAVLLLAGLWLVRAFIGEGPPRIWLNEKDLQLIEPVGEVPSFERFAWKYDKDAASYTLRIYAGGDEGGTPLVDAPAKESTWIPDAKTLRELPRRIHWEVEARDAFGQLLAVRGASASLSSR